MRLLHPRNRHTPKCDLSTPITQNHLAGSKKLYNFFDTVFAIGMSAKDSQLRYVKQINVRAGAFRYDASNVIVYEIDKADGLLRFNFRDFSTEEEHLRHKDAAEVSENEMRILDLEKEGLSYREIAAKTGLSKRYAGKIVKQHKDKLSTVHENPIYDGQVDADTTDEDDE